MAQDPEVTPAGGGDTSDDQADPLARPSKEARRADETVMLSSDSLSDMVSSARTAEPAPAATPSQPSSAAAGSGSSPNMLLIVGVVVVVALVIAIVVALTA